MKIYGCLKPRTILVFWLANVCSHILLRIKVENGKMLSFFLSFFLWNWILSLQLMCQVTTHILQNSIQLSCTVWHLLKYYETLKSGGAELVSSVVWADLLVPSRSCAALVLVQIYTAERIVCLAHMNVAILKKRVQLVFEQVGTKDTGWGSWAGLWVLSVGSQERARWIWARAQLFVLNCFLIVN